MTNDQRRSDWFLDVKGWKHGKPARSWRERLSKYPRKARRAEILLLDLARMAEQAQYVGDRTVNDVRCRYLDRAACYTQRGLRVQLWLHWEKGEFHQAKALLVKAEKEGQQDFWGLL